MNGSVATLSGLVQLPFGAENPELPPDEIEESEKVEQTEPDRSKVGRLPTRLSLMRSHSCEGLSMGFRAVILGIGVLGVARRVKRGSGDSKLLVPVVG